MPVSMYCAPPPDSSRLREIDDLIKKSIAGNKWKELVHGTDYAYHVIPCRCRKCTEAHRKAGRAWELKNIEHRKKYQRARYLRKLANKIA